MACMICEETIVPGELVTLGAPCRIANAIPPELIERAEREDAAIHVCCQNDYQVDNFERIEYEAPEFCWRWRTETREQIVARNAAILALANRNYEPSKVPLQIRAAGRFATDLT